MSGCTTEEVGSVIVSVAARGLQVAMLCREGTAGSGVGSQYLSAMGKGGGGVILGPPLTPLRYTHPHQSPSGSPSSKMAPPVWSRFYDEIW